MANTTAAVNNSAIKDQTTVTGSSVVPSVEPVVNNGPLLVVKDYVRQGKRKQPPAQQHHAMQKCPITGEPVPISQFAEHLRIVLLDPQWRLVL